jgi:DNA-binding transcriptional MerR regulator
MAEVTARLSIGQVAERTGLSVHALRFYEHEGLFVNPVRRDSGGRRVYTEDDVDWLTVCIILRASGMPLPALRRYTELVRRGDGNEEERLGLLREHRAAVTSQMSRLAECLDLISFKIGVYEDILDSAARGCHAPAVEPIVGITHRADPMETAQ